MVNSIETIFITGSSGFIGRNIVEFFENDYNILAPPHKELDLLSQEDVNEFFDDNDIDYVIHCANLGGNRKAIDSPDIVEKNTRMFFNIVENSTKYKKLIHLGSGAEYSKDSMPPKVTEDYLGTVIPKDYYGFSKYIISKYIENTENIYCLRLFGVFGRYEDYEFKFISNSILKNILEMPITIMQNVYFDWIYIDDLLNIINYFIENKPSKNIFNASTGKKTDLITISNIINENSDFKSDINIINEGLNKEYSANNDRLMNEIKNYKFKSMEEAIKELFNYYKSNIDIINCEIVIEDPYAARCKINRES